MRQGSKRLKTLANENDCDVFDGFFSNNEDNDNYDIRDDLEDYSPNYTPRNGQKVTYCELLELDSPRNSVTSSARRRLVARVTETKAPLTSKSRTRKRAYIRQRKDGDN